MKRIQFYTIISLLALCLPGCSDTSEFKDEPHPEPSGSGIANIELDISLLDLAANTRTRADETYETAATPQELINMLRIIIVDGDGYVEHNRLIDLKEEPKSDYKSGIFKVKASDTKQVYIFANELPMTDQWVGNGYYPFGNLLPGLKFDAPAIGETVSPKDAIENLIVKADPETHILFDNTGETKTNIPINEHFEFKVGEADYNSENGLGTIDNPYIYNCFITRAATKFTFNATYEGAADLPALGTLTIKEIHLRAIGDREYLLPKNTIYDPAKATPLEASTPSESILPRNITSFGVPSDAINKDLVFPVGFEFTNSKTGVQTFGQNIYFPETIISPDNKYQIRIVTSSHYGENPPIENEDNILTSEWASLDNLPLLPRNTHVIVNITLKTEIVDGVVDLVPYIGIVLTPGFGFDQLLPGDHERPEDW